MTITNRVFCFFVVFLGGGGLALASIEPGSLDHESSILTIAPRLLAYPRRTLAFTDSVLLAVGTRIVQPALHAPRGVGRDPAKLYSIDH